jgi:hypothetical protein
MAAYACRRRLEHAMSILVTYRRCGAEFVPGREAIIVDAWRLCPVCCGGDAENTAVTEESAT